MGNDEAVTTSKNDKSSSPVQEQPVIHPYADWAAMQAYYGPGVPMPPLYFNNTLAPGHPPHPYLWGAQPMMSPFPTPYTAIYPPGVYPHPPTMPPSTAEVSSKSSDVKGRGLTKKLKGFDGLAVSIGNVNAEITVGNGSGQSQSCGENGTEGSSDVSDENNESGEKENQRKRKFEVTPTSGDSKAGALVNAVHIGEANVTPEISEGAIVSQSMCILPLHTKDERELKREKRKQSNRESARRSRLRKQAETEELAVRVESLSAENSTLRSEICLLKENLEKLKAENSALMDNLKDKRENNADKLENEEAPTKVVENFLSRIDESRQDENNEKSNRGNLRQLLDSNHRNDAVVTR